MTGEALRYNEVVPHRQEGEKHMDVLVTTAQMAVMVGVSERSIQRWIQEGRLQATRLEDSALYSVQQAELDRLRFRSHRAEEDRMQGLERRAAEQESLLKDAIATLRLNAEHLQQLDGYTRILSEQIRHLQAALDCCLT
jgi:excisionase family DNA binding protein